MTMLDQSAGRPLGAGRSRAVVRAAREAFFVVVVPTLLTGLVLEYLVPVTGSGFPGLVASTGRRARLYVGAALFLTFMAIARYWRLQLGADVLDAPVAAPTKPSGEVGAGAWRPPRAVLAFVGLVGAAVVAALLLRAVVATPYRVVGSSMLPTLESGDLVLGARRPYGGEASRVRRGDVVVFSAVGLGPAALASIPGVLLKRVIGLPGDRIEMSGAVPVINGWRVPSCDAGSYVTVQEGDQEHPLAGRLRVEFLDDRYYLTVDSPSISAFRGPTIVKPGEVFVLGDNRANSLDSRALGDGHGGGVPIPALVAQIHGFLVGTHRSGGPDWTRLLRPTSELEKRVRLEGLDTELLDRGVARCLADRPADAHPPAPSL